MRKDLFQQLKAFCIELRNKERRSRDVRFWAREGLNEARCDSVSADRHDDGNRRSGLLGSARPRCPVRYDNIDIEANKFGHQIGEALVFALCPSELDDNATT